MRYLDKLMWTVFLLLVLIYVTCLRAGIAGITAQSSANYWGNNESIPWHLGQKGNADKFDTTFFRL